MKKRFIIGMLALLAAMLLCLSGCGGDGSRDDDRNIVTVFAKGTVIGDDRIAVDFSASAKEPTDDLHAGILMLSYDADVMIPDEDAVEAFNAGRHIAGSDGNMSVDWTYSGTSALSGYNKPIGTDERQLVHVEFIVHNGSPEDALKTVVLCRDGDFIEAHGGVKYGSIVLLTLGDAQNFTLADGTIEYVSDFAE